MDYNFKPTTNGRAALAACMSLGKPPDICRVAFGSGKISEDVNLADQHTLLEYVADGTIASRRHKDDHFYFTIQYANNEHPNVGTFYLSEFIVYIKDPVTEAETDLLCGTLGDYRLPVPKYHANIAPSVFDLPLVLVISDDVTVQVSAPPGLVTYDDLQEAVGQAMEEAAKGHELVTNAQKGAPGGIASLDDAGKILKSQMPWTHYIVTTRPRTPGKPTYGMGGGGDDGGEKSVVLEAGPYTGATEAGVMISGVLYDAQNMSTNGESAPDGTIIIKTEENNNG